MRITARKLTLMAALTAVALIVFIIEAQIPLPLPIPGAKLGLANTVTLFALFFRRSDGDKQGVDSSSRTRENVRAFPLLTTADAFMILVCRIILGAVFAGRIMAFIYSIAGGLFGFAAQVLMKRIVTDKQIWVCSAIGAMFHNIGQILAAMLVTGTPSIIAYLPLLIIAGIATGVITGLVAQFTIARVNPRSGDGRL